MEEPITDEATKQIRDSVLAVPGQGVTRPAGPEGKKPEPMVVFEFLPGEEPRREPAGGLGRPGASSSLGDQLAESAPACGPSRSCPSPCSGYAVLPVLACDEIVMGSGATLGPITPEGKAVDDEHAAPRRDLASRRSAREPELALFLGMLDQDPTSIG